MKCYSLTTNFLKYCNISADLVELYWKLMEHETNSISPLIFITVPVAKKKVSLNVFLGRFKQVRCSF